MDFDKRVLVKSDDIICEGIIIRKVKSKIKGTNPVWWLIEIKEIKEQYEYKFNVGEVILFSDEDVNELN